MPDCRLTAACLCLALLVLPGRAPALPTKKVLDAPHKILRNTTDLNSAVASPEAMQLAEQLGILPLFSRMEDLRLKVQSGSSGPTLESLALRQELYEARQEALVKLERARLDIDYVLAEIYDEQGIYTELVQAYQNDASRKQARTNALGFGTNGLLWAVTEALTIPTYNHPRYSIPSGTLGILAGVIPSVASFLSLKQAGARHKIKQEEPNMLAKMFDYPTTPAIEYPRSVWTFLTTSPAGRAPGLTRRAHIIERWIADKNISSFTDSNSRPELALLTASEGRPTTLSLDLLSARQAMLQQLAAEIFKMTRLLLELNMVLSGEKHPGQPPSYFTLPESEPPAVPVPGRGERTQPGGAD